MANPVKGEASVTLGDKRTLVLAYDFNTLIEAEDALPGESMAAVLQAMFPGEDKEAQVPRLKVFRALLWGGLRRHHPDIDLEAAGNLVGREGETLLPAMMKAMAEAFDDGKGAAADDAQPDPPAKG